MAAITPEQRQAIEEAGEQPLRVADPETHTEYVILKAEIYERMRALLETDCVDRSLYEFGEFHPIKS